MLNYWRDDVYQDIINQKDSIVYVDGMGVIYAQKLLKLPVAKERIATTDLFPALCNYLNETKSPLRIFLIGGSDGTAENVMDRFFIQYPNVHIVGTHHGYFDKRSSSKVIKYINSHKVDILFVGFGNPIQEKWVHQHFHRLRVCTFITCGGLFDYYANNVKRAPLFMQKIGLEWLYRLVQEPRRLFKRYIFGNIKYVWKVMRMKLSKALRSSKEGNL
ncbi:WecB/TagA/CpsF family glycosyltransferase [Ureibacillus manganicus]|uniref:WecB/TagA/CpsF family glycosyltransferase n=1 Tax=Ureibacillus manganicus TaxID=1266064 RepID=UPI00146DBCFE|nr:WecB/TagA/CpsF family glycosyltransferase [Ureibacillus manganicus]